MGNTVLILIIFILLITVTLLTCLVIKTYIESNVDRPGITAKNNSRLYNAGDVLTLGQWLGKTADETGANEKYFLEEYGSLKVSFAGKLFEKDANGSVYFSSESGEFVQHASTVYISASGLEYEECRDSLSELYGEPQNEHEEPFTEVKGGAVRRCFFYDGDNEIMLESASEKENIDITIKKK
ncbi:MAG: hypothetical protein K6C14_07190 [Eubacterium sp.]|nr:hypothetical protein [Eubacterium sp.]